MNTQKHFQNIITNFFCWLKDFILKLFENEKSIEIFSCTSLHYNICNIFLGNKNLKFWFINHDLKHILQNVILLKVE
jgi:hypothetical protein